MGYQLPVGAPLGVKEIMKLFPNSEGKIRQSLSQLKIYKWSYM